MARGGISSWQNRLASWADRRLLRGSLAVLLLADLTVGANWLLATPGSLTSPVYDVAKNLTPMDVWGALFLIGAAAAIASFLGGGRQFVSGYLVGGLLAAQWGFWTVLFTFGPMGRPGASYTAAILAACMCLLHCLSGLAYTHRPPEPVAAPNRT